MSITINLMKKCTQVNPNNKHIKIQSISQIVMELTWSEIDKNDTKKGYFYIGHQYKKIPMP